MPGMFYSSKEAAEKLGKTEAQVRQLAKDGKLREFRDGATLLFKMEEVETLLTETSAPAMKAPPAKAAQPPKAAKAVKPPPVPEPQPEPQELPEPDFQLEELTAEPGPESQLEEIPELEPTAEAQAIGEAEPEIAKSESAESEPELGGEAAVESAAGVEQEEILLAPEAASTAGESDITTMDTALTGQGVNVLSEGDSEHPVTEDTMAETVAPTGTTTEASLEEIEEDVNLDSFGSGSGLLDLSLQADDTSLGGILDEIYTAEGAEEAKGAKSPAAEASAPDEFAAESEPAGVGAEDAMAAPEAVPQMPVMAQAYMAAMPDVQSNTFGVLLFLPLAVLLYTAIVTVAALRGVAPSILTSVQGVIWYVLIGAVVVTGLMVGGVVAKSSGLLARKPKASKEPKAKKEKKTKKGKEPAKEAEQ